ncbi:hypothetical protein DL96DRAFT_1556185 [Flagelloscypha sp. PMI_526]|nr:hypothetical protein DL96DRAFT_1556185 [Flagelloscypha sp. PMI_526]
MLSRIAALGSTSSSTGSPTTPTQSPASAQSSPASYSPASSLASFTFPQRSSSRAHLREGSGSSVGTVNSIRSERERNFAPTGPRPSQARIPAELLAGPRPLPSTPAPSPRDPFMSEVDTFLTSITSDLKELEERHEETRGWLKTQLL